MKKLIKMPSIEQFRNIVTNINRKYNFVDLDEKGEAIYDHSLPKPIINFKGTIKLHGTNASICFNSKDGLWAQSKENIITPKKDNAGFAWFAETKKEVFETIAKDVADVYELNLDNNTVSIYGEWAGKGIQKNVTISNLETKSFFIFGAKITPHTENEDELKEKPAYWVDSSFLKSVENNIFNIEDFKTYSIDIDFNRPDLIIDELLELTLSVEEECPVGNAFGFKDIGEGLVFTGKFKDEIYRFKSKGQKHSNSKVKILKSVDSEEINKKIELAQKVCPSWRLEQMLSETFNLINGGELDRSKLGEYIKSVINDIIKEEIDIISEAGFEIKDIGKYVSEIAKSFYFEKELI